MNIGQRKQMLLFPIVAIHRSTTDNARNRKTYYQRHKEKLRARGRTYASQQKPHRAEYHRHRITEQKNIVYGFFGKKCNRCGYSDERALQVDHINGGGRQQARYLGLANIYQLLSKLVLENPEEAKKNYQILCANCNWIKRAENKECPHASV